MELSHPLWLWALLALPLVWSIFFLYSRRQEPLHQLEKFIDKHLIPYLLIGGEQKKKRLWMPLLFWSLVWSCLVLAMAGPRWDFREIPTFSSGQNLAILLDLSESMNAKDVSPSRLGRAKQKIEDLLNTSKGVKIGLIAFAADPHMIVPMTEDKEAVRHLLPTLDTDLVYVQGSKLDPALEMAAAMLENEPGNSKAILVISDGGFQDTSALHTAKKLADKGIVLHTLGVGTMDGAPLKVKKSGSSIISKLEKEKFQEISKIGHGRYFDAGHSGEIASIFDRSTSLQVAQTNRRIWEEHFYLFLLPVLPFFLLWYRRGYIFALLLIPSYSHAYFLNTEQQAAQCYENGEFAEAAATFQDPYRKGVAYYRMGDYKSAEEMFRESARSDYNLGNALAKQNKLHDAIKAYEDALEKNPDHIQAKENLELVKKMVEEQQEKEQEQQQEQEQQEQEQQEQEQQEKEGDEQQQEQPSSPKRSQEDQDADLWLDQIKNDPKSFLKNKFYLESKKNGTKEEVDPW